MSNKTENDAEDKFPNKNLLTACALLVRELEESARKICESESKATTVYIVFSGTPDYKVKGVFSRRELAEIMKKSLKDDYPYIDEYGVIG